MKQAMLTALCTLLLLSVALGGVGYSDTVNYLENTVGVLTNAVDKVSGFFGKKEEDFSTEIGGAKSELGVLGAFDMTLAEGIIFASKTNYGVEIPRIDAIYPYTYTAVIDNVWVVEGIRFVYDGSDYIFWFGVDYNYFKGYKCHNGLKFDGYSNVVKIGIGLWQFWVVNDLANFKRNPFNIAFNFGVTQTNNTPLEFFVNNVHF